MAAAVGRGCLVSGRPPSHPHRCPPAMSERPPVAAVPPALGTVSVVDAGGQTHFKGAVTVCPRLTGDRPGAPAGTAPEAERGKTVP